MTGHARLLSAVIYLFLLASIGGANHAAQLSTRINGSLLAVPAVAAAVATDANPSSNSKLIALTFDDGPRPYVLLGSKGAHGSMGLLDVLDKEGVKATFFVVGWRLTPRTWGDPKHEENVGVTCLDAAEEVIRHGHELQDHTFSHIELGSAEKKRGEQWVINDVDRGAEAIKAITGTEPRYLRPPDWIIAEDARRDLERHGYRVLTIAGENPIALRDVNSLDYLCAGRAVGCPRPSLVDGVLKQIEQREKKGIYTHILAFHELSSTAAIMPELIGDLKARGYRFVTVSQYMSLVAPKNQQLALSR